MTARHSAVFGGSNDALTRRLCVPKHWVPSALLSGGWCAQKGVVDTQLIAHDREVYDIAWGGVGVFASVSADGSVRVFDLRCKRRPMCWSLATAPEEVFCSLLALTCNRASPPGARDKEHSTIIYESPQPNQPLLRLGWNKQDPRYMATLLLDCAKVVVLDIRCCPARRARIAPRGMQGRVR